MYAVQLDTFFRFQLSAIAINCIHELCLGKGILPKCCLCFFLSLNSSVGIGGTKMLSVTCGEYVTSLSSRRFVRTGREIGRMISFMGFVSCHHVTICKD